MFESENGYLHEAPTGIVQESCGTLSSPSLPNRHSRLLSRRQTLRLRCRCRLFHHFRPLHLPNPSSDTLTPVSQFNLNLLHFDESKVNDVGELEIKYSQLKLLKSRLLNCLEAKQLPQESQLTHTGCDPISQKSKIDCPTFDFDAKSLQETGCDSTPEKMKIDCGFEESQTNFDFDAKPLQESQISTGCDLISEKLKMDGGYEDGLGLDEHVSPNFDFDAKPLQESQISTGCDLILEKLKMDGGYEDGLGLDEHISPNFHFDVDFDFDFGMEGVEEMKKKGDELLLINGDDDVTNYCRSL